MVYATIQVSEETKLKFDQLQLDLKVKKILKTQDELVKMLMDSFKEFQKIRRKKE